MSEQTGTAERLTLDTLSVGAQVVIRPGDEREPLQLATVTAINKTKIVTDKGEFTRRNGKGWGYGDAWHYPSIARATGTAGWDSLMTWEEAAPIIQSKRDQIRVGMLARQIEDRIRQRKGISLDQLRRIAAILDEGKEVA